MNKQIMSLCCIMVCSINCYGAATNMMERAKKLYTPEIVASPEIDMQKGVYQQFVCDLPSFVREATQEEISALETYLVSTITSLVVHVSTNEVRQGPSLSYLRGRGSALWDIMTSFIDQTINTNVCLDIAYYIGRVKRTPFPEDLACVRQSIVYYNPDPEKMKEWKANQEAWRRKRNHQFRVYCDNSSVDDYREELFEACGWTLPSSKKIMSPEAFIAFTNEIVKASNASPREQENLFKKLKK